MLNYLGVGCFDDGSSLLLDGLAEGKHLSGQIWHVHIKKLKLMNLVGRETRHQ